MATYDLEQQEQLDQLKAFWKQYGNLITWLLVAALGAYAAWTGYLYWQQQRAQGAGGLYEELDRAATAGDGAKVNQALADLKAKYAGTTFAEHGALLAARAAVSRKAPADANAALQWLIQDGKNPDLVAVARLRLAGQLMDDKKYDEALKVVSAEMPPEFAAAAADRRGDILVAQNKKDEAVKAYQEAYKSMPEDLEYRRFIEGKLTVLGQAPASSTVGTVSPMMQSLPPSLPPGLVPNR
jgi:predicted negative regulator of RcsB-dependent stress response